MQTGIIGLPYSGKSTILNTITGSNYETGLSATQTSPNIGVAHVPDGRLDHLTEIYKPKKTINAELIFSEIPSKQDGEIFSGENISHLQQLDALIIVVRAFKNQSVPHISGSIDFERDLEKITFDLLFSDINLIEKRILKIQDSFSGMKSSDRDKANKTIETLKNIQSDIEKGIPIRSMDLSDHKKLALSDTFLISSLPLMVIINIDEKDIENSSIIHEKTIEIINEKANESAVICAELEEEISKLLDEDQDEMRKELNIEVSGLERAIQLTYASLGLISFITVGEDEVRAWTIKANTTAQKAASAIHSDIAKGFIRAEVVSYNDYIKYNSMVEIKNKGLLRKEGKEYTIKDGDIVNYLFSV